MADSAGSEGERHAGDRPGAGVVHQHDSLAVRGHQQQTYVGSVGVRQGSRSP